MTDLWLSMYGGALMAGLLLGLLLTFMRMR